MTFPLLFIIMMTVSLGVMNLILAVIVERAAEARANDKERRLKEKEQERASNMVDLAKLCASMDVDGSGSLSLDEMLQGFDESEAFQALMEHMDVKRDDVETIFNVLDEDRSGEVSYLEFCKHLGSFFERDPKIVGSLVKYSMIEVRQVIKEEAIAILHQHTEMLTEQRLLLDGLRHSAKAADLKRSDTLISEPQEHVIRFEGPDMTDLASRSLQNLQSLETTQLSIEPLLSKAEALAEAAMLESWALAASESSEIQSDTPNRKRASKGLKRKETQTLEKAGSNSKLQASKVLGQELEDRFSLLCSRFQERMREAQNVHDRCQKIMTKLEQMKGGLVQDLLSMVAEERL